MLGAKGILTPLIPDCSVLHTITILNDIFVVSDFVRICSIHIRNFCNRDISGAIISMNQFFHLPNLKTVYHDVHHCLRGIRIISLRLGDRHPHSKASESAAQTSSGCTVTIVAALDRSRPSTIKSTVFSAAP